MRLTFGQWLYLQSKGLAALALLAYFSTHLAAFLWFSLEGDWQSHLLDSAHYARMVAAFIWTVIWVTQ